jgi:hydrogenase 3 maturation protease
MQKLDNLIDDIKGKRVVIVGVGNTMLGDDGLGPVLIERLQGNTSAILFDGGEMPENLISPIIKARPEVLILVDAAELSKAPGEMELIRPEDIGGFGGSTHSLPLDRFLKFIGDKIPNLKAYLIGVQFKSKKFGNSLGLEMQESLGKLEKFFKGI